MMENKDMISEKIVRVGFYSMGISVLAAGIMVILIQLNVIISESIYVLWPVMLILLGFETIISKLSVDISKKQYRLKPSWGAIIIATILIGCTEIFVILVEADLLSHIHW